MVSLACTVKVSGGDICHGSWDITTQLVAILSVGRGAMLATEEPEIWIVEQERPITIRHAHAGDADAIANLLPLLGYGAEPHEIVFRLERMALEPNNTVLVADMDRTVVGLCQVQGVRLIANEGYAEINALVVRPSHQGRGIGKSLVDSAIGWAEERCYAKVRLWSQVNRLGAHCFYEAYGFSKSRTSYAFEYVLTPAWADRSDDLRNVGLPGGVHPEINQASEAANRTPALRG
jgi:GNAT superfamily N-acetyltransferase